MSILQKSHPFTLGREKLKISLNTLPFLKLQKKNKQILKKELEKLHPYDVPEIAEINVESINQPYMKWLVDSTT